MKSFFENIDTSKPFLLIGDTWHGDKSIRDDFVMTEEFARQACANGYTKILIEAERSEKIQKHIDQDYKKLFEAGILVCPVDARDERFKKSGQLKALRLQHSFMLALLRGNRGDEGSFIQATGLASKTSYYSKQRREKRLAFEPATLANILQEANGEKVIVFYGAAHFKNGSPIEREIPQEQRTLVNLVGAKYKETPERGPDPFFNNPLDAQIYDVTGMRLINTSIECRASIPERPIETQITRIGPPPAVNGCS
jgi:hypothetical protein